MNVSIASVESRDRENERSACQSKTTTPPIQYGVVLFHFILFGFVRFFVPVKRVPTQNTEFYGIAIQSTNCWLVKHQNIKHRNIRVFISHFRSSNHANELCRRLSFVRFFLFFSVFSLLYRYIASFVFTGTFRSDFSISLSFGTLSATMSKHMH